MNYSRFDRVFHPEKLLQDKKLSDMDPCAKCPTHIEYMQTAIYGSIAERQYMETPEACKSCLQRSLWVVDCLTKLAWYENQDPRFAMKDQSPA